jgi:hypothetical protein
MFQYSIHNYYIYKMQLTELIIAKMKDYIQETSTKEKFIRSV